MHVVHKMPGAVPFVHIALKHLPWINIQLSCLRALRLIIPPGCTCCITQTNITAISTP